MMHFSFSSLTHTWIIDIDGTILKHNGHMQGHEVLLNGVRDFWATIPSNDVIILMSARDPIYENSTVSFLRINNIRYNYILFGLPMGERVLINDIKPSGLITAYAVNVKRDFGLDKLSISTLK